MLYEKGGGTMVTLSNMNKKIDSIRLINIQSYKDETVKFNKGINRIKAGNDNGKSVLKKSLELVCGGKHSTPSEISSMLRNHTTQGFIMLRLTDGFEIIACLGKTTGYIVRTPEGEETMFPLRPHPKEVRDITQMLITEDFCLNIRSADEPLALVHTPERLNNEILTAGFENPKIEQYLVNIIESIKEIDSNRNSISLIRGERLTQLHRLPDENLTQLRLEKLKVDKLLNDVETYINIAPSVKGLRTLLQSKQEIEYKKSALNLDTGKMIDLYNHNIQLKSKLGEMLKQINLKSDYNRLKLFNNISTLSVNLTYRKEIINHIDKQKEVKDLVRKYENISKQLNNIKQIRSLMKSKESIENKVNVNNNVKKYITKYKQNYNTIQKIKQISSELCKLNEGIYRQDTIKSLIKSVEKPIETYHKQYETYLKINNTKTYSEYLYENHTQKQTKVEQYLKRLYRKYECNLSTLSEIKNQQSIISELHKTYEYKKLNRLKIDMVEIYTILNCVKKFRSTLTAIETYDEKIVPINEGEIQYKTDTLWKISKIYERLKTLRQDITYVELNKKEINDINMKLAKYDICPFCNSQINKHDNE